jgi:hypothetical protein
VPADPSNTVSSSGTTKIGLLHEETAVREAEFMRRAFDACETMLLYPSATMMATNTGGTKDRGEPDAPARTSTAFPFRVSCDDMSVTFTLICAPPESCVRIGESINTFSFTAETRLKSSPAAAL